MAINNRAASVRVTSPVRHRASSSRLFFHFRRRTSSRGLGEGIRQDIRACRSSLMNVRKLWSSQVSLMPHSQRGRQHIDYKARSNVDDALFRRSRNVASDGGQTA